jgi:hypothetical protein
MTMKKTLLTSLSVIALMMLPAAQAATHLGQSSAASHVTLIAKTIPNPSQANKCTLASFSNQNLYRIGTNGVAEATPFVVPSGQYLVITDIEWTARGGLTNIGSFTANWPLRLDISIVKPSTMGSGNLVYTSPGITVDPVDVDNILGSTDNLTSGIVVGAGSSLCPGAYQSRPNSWGARALNSFVVHGYLTP